MTREATGETLHSLMTLGEKLLKARNARGWSQEDVGKHLGVTRSAVHLWEADGSVPRMPKLHKLAELYQVDLAWLLNGNDEAPSSSFAGPTGHTPLIATPFGRKIPVINYVQAGDWTEVQADESAVYLGFVYSDIAVGPRAFALEVEGLSMVPDLSPGDRIIVDPDAQPVPGSLVVAHLDDEPRATVKRYRDRGTDSEGRRIIELSPSNEDYATLRIDAHNPGRIVGTVVETRTYPRTADSA